MNFFGFHLSLVLFIQLQAVPLPSQSGTGFLSGVLLKCVALSYKHNHLISMHLTAHYGLFRVPSPNHSGPWVLIFKFPPPEFLEAKYAVAYQPFYLRIRVIQFPPTFPPWRMPPIVIGRHCHFHRS